MATGRILKVVQYPDKLLRTPCKPVLDVSASNIQQLIQDMLTTVRIQEGLGLAAPQVGETHRLFVMRTPAQILGGRANRRRFSTAKRFQACINPRIKRSSSRQELGLEACLSIPDHESIVRRKYSIDVAFTGLDGNPIHQKLEGLPAVVFQHELDHLDGVLITDRELTYPPGEYEEVYMKARERFMSGLLRWYNDDPFAEKSIHDEQNAVALD